jgi:hypothetical protein
MEIMMTEPEEVTEAQVQEAIAELEQLWGDPAVRQAWINLAKKGLVVPQVRRGKLVRRNGQVVGLPAPTHH